jgi:hypothetical protein
MSEVKVNKITPTTNCGTVTLGDSGDTVAIPCGVTLTSAGSITNSGTITNTGTISGGTITGTIDNQVNWDTTAKTANFTAVAGNGYFVNTTSGAITVTLPATPSAGDLVGIKDYANTADTNNITIARNGSNIQGIANDFTISTEGLAITLIYVDGTQGWVSTGAAQASNITAPQFIVATGGTIVDCGNYRTHIFTSPGTFCVSSLANPSGGPNTVDYLVVAGGGGGTGNQGAGGGGGAGGFRISNCATRSGISAPTMSPLVTTTGITVTASPYPIAVGGGGAAVPGSAGPGGNSGSNSVFSTITSTGGGYGGNDGAPPTVGVAASGGSGGGSGANQPGANGNTPPTSPPQGNAGGASPPTAPGGCNSGGGGGGAAGIGVTPGGGNPTAGGNGGIGSYISDNIFGPTAPSYGTPGPVGSTRYFAGGGGGGSHSGAPNGQSSAGAGGAGGGGSGWYWNGSTFVNQGGCAAASSGTANTGGGAGASARRSGVSGAPNTGSGGSGIVIIRYKYQ